VYCDVATQSIVSDTKSPLLRVRNVTGTNGRVVHATYNRPHNLPVRRREIDAIEIVVNNELGKPMLFRVWEISGERFISGDFETTVLLRRKS
jgi:hypothetical protein